MADRLSCCVPYCRRSRHNREGFSAWICGKHWMAVSAVQRRRYYKMRRQYRRRFGDNSFWCYPAGSTDRIAAARMDKVLSRMWERCKSEAIEIAAGI